MIQVTGGSTEPFAANQELGIELRSDPVSLGTVTSTDSGTYLADVQIPANTEEGTHTIVVSGLHRDGGRLESVATIEVVGSSTAEGTSSAGQDNSTPAMALTGWSPNLLGVAIALVSVGGLLSIWAKRREEDDVWVARSPFGRRWP
jgi:hypothetical protein